MNLIGGGAMILFMVLYIGLIGFSIFLMVLMVRLGLRGIKALDIYIDEHSKTSDY